MKIAVEKIEAQWTARPKMVLELYAAGRVKDGWLWINLEATRRILAIYWPERLADLPKIATKATTEPPPGLGTLLAKAIHPIAKLADRHLGTNLTNCKKCKNRQRAMDQATAKIREKVGL